jgi:hypothetical protein
VPDIFIDQDPLNPDPVKDEGTKVAQEESKKPLPLTAMHSKHELMKNLGIRSHHGSLTALSSYFEDPDKVKFSNKLDEEILLLFLRRHFITNFPWFIKAIALALIPVVFEILSTFGLFSTNFASPTGKTLIYGFYYFFVVSGYIFINYMHWFYNISLVTNIRIIDIDFSEIVFENVDATKLSQVEDVGYKQIGILRSIFDYGDVHLQTAGTASNFEFLAIPHPENVIRIINNLLGKTSHE